jgi:hypothetical protein
MGMDTGSHCSVVDGGERCQRDMEASVMHVWHGPKVEMVALMPDAFEWAVEAGLNGIVPRVVQCGEAWAVDMPGLERDGE